MIKISLFIIGVSMFYGSECFAGYTRIDSLDDCNRVTNNISIFWRNNGDLINKMKNNDVISEKDISYSSDKSNKMIIDGMIKEFRQDKSSYSSLKKSIVFVENNAGKVEEKIGKTKYLNLSRGLVFLVQLIDKLHPEEE